MAPGRAGGGGEGGTRRREGAEELSCCRPRQERAGAVRRCGDAICAHFPGTKFLCFPRRCRPAVRIGFLPITIGSAKENRAKPADFSPGDPDFRGTMPCKGIRASRHAKANECGCSDQLTACLIACDTKIISVEHSGNEYQRHRTVNPVLLCLGQLLKATGQIFLSGGGHLKDIRFRLQADGISSAAASHRLLHCARDRPAR